MFHEAIGLSVPFVGLLIKNEITGSRRIAHKLARMIESLWSKDTEQGSAVRLID